MPYCAVPNPNLTLTFQPQNHATSRISRGHSLYQVSTLGDNLFLSYAADKQTDGCERSTHADRTNQSITSVISPFDKRFGGSHPEVV